MRPASVAPRGAFGRILSARQAVTAAQACAGYATYAGWTNNASHDDLVTASAICMAESGGQPTVYYCNPTGKDGYYPPVTCSGVYDRGLWQIDNQAWASITNTCAFTAKCNADGAYAISQHGASFSPWATYTSGVYSNYLSAAQSAIRALRGGTVPSGVAGVCLSRAAYAQDAAVITSTCGSGAGRQQWRIGRHAVRDGEVLPRGRVAVHDGSRPPPPVQREQLPAVDGPGQRTAAQRPGRPVPARPEQHGHPGNPGQRGLVHRGCVARLVAPLSTRPPPAVPRPAARSASGRAASSGALRLRPCRVQRRG